MRQAPSNFVVVSDHCRCQDPSKFVSVILHCPLHRDAKSHFNADIVSLLLGRQAARPPARRHPRRRPRRIRAKKPAGAQVANKSCCAWLGWTLCLDMQKSNCNPITGWISFFGPPSAEQETFMTEISKIWQKHEVQNQKRYSRCIPSTNFWGLAYLF